MLQHDAIFDPRHRIPLGSSRVKAQHMAEPEGTLLGEQTSTSDL